jgi:dipeptidyl aminopeptidase/acylaminoacyl peptidase
VGYGGGDFTAQGRHVWFAAQRTGRLFRQPLEAGEARPITPSFGQAAAPAVTPDGAWVAYVHHDEAGVDRLAVVDAAGRSWPAILHAGHDFYMQPRWSPDGRQLAWVAWDHPNMPWDGSLLYIAPVLGGEDAPPRLGPARVVAGGPEVAILQPEWSPDGSTLFYISDETGWGQLWRQDLNSGQRRALTTGDAEHGTPAWGQGTRTFALAAGGGHAWVVRGERGIQRIVRVDTATGLTSDVPRLAEYSAITALAAAPTGDRLAFVASSPTCPPRVVLYEAGTGAVQVLARAAGETVVATELARPSPIAWPSAHGETAHGLLYLPASARFTNAGKPPLVVTVHGGPTSQARASWDPQAQFLATRGYAVLALNFRGSTGYGRAYMTRLYGHWGVCDVEDAVSGVDHLARGGHVDRDRAVIMGGSSGGFTVLQAMIDHPEVFAAGVCSYGVSNQLTLVADTHKFEARYNDRLIGPLPDAADLYRARSPALHASAIRRPLALFHGAEDKVVPRAQSDAIAEALERSGTPHIYHVYEGEGHGWRRPETVAHYWQSVDAFLRQHVLFA